MDLEVIGLSGWVGSLKPVFDEIELEGRAAVTVLTAGLLESCCFNLRIVALEFIFLAMSY